MPKPPVHPIVKMQDACFKAYGFKEGWTIAGDEARERAVMRRHIAPLLKALERSVDPERQVRHDVRADRYGPCDCADCQLLARWRAK